MAFCFISTRLSSWSLLLVAVVLALPNIWYGFLMPGVQGCGTSVHGEIAFRASTLLTSSVRQSAHRASPSRDDSSILEDRYNSDNLLSFEKLIRDRKQMLLAGSFFPDWGYNCIGLKWNNAAEDVGCLQREGVLLLLVHDFTQ